MRFWSRRDGLVKRSNRRFTQEAANEFLNILTYFNEVSEVINIDLRDNFFDNKHMEKLGEALKKHSSIKELYLWLPCNCIQDEGVKLLLKNLSSLKNLEKLVLNLEWLIKKEF